MKKNKQKLIEIFKSISTPEEVKALDASKVNAIIKIFEDNEKELTTDFEGKFNALLGSVEKYRKAVNQYNTSFIDQFSEFASGFTKSLEKLGGTITTSYEKNKPFNASGVYKDMINQLSAIDKSIKDKPVPVWNWPQYASVSVRNKNFANINPATDGLGIGDYDYVSLALTNSTTETYTFKSGGASGNLVATVVVVYTDSTKATLSTVTKTPIQS